MGHYPAKDNRLLLLLPAGLLSRVGNRVGLCMAAAAKHRRSSPGGTSRCRSGSLLPDLLSQNGRFASSVRLRFDLLAVLGCRSVDTAIRYNPRTPASDGNRLLGPLYGELDFCTGAHRNRQGKIVEEYLF